MYSNERIESHSLAWTVTPRKKQRLLNAVVVTAVAGHNGSSTTGPVCPGQEVTLTCTVTQTGGNNTI